MQRAIETDTHNMAASTAAYYRDLAVASNSKLVGDVEELFPAVDRLALRARQNPRNHLSSDGAWSLKRACHFAGSRNGDSTGLLRSGSHLPSSTLRFFQRTSSSSAQSPGLLPVGDMWERSP